MFAWCGVVVHIPQGYFALVGPKSNPAGLNSRGDGILTMLGKIAVGGKDDDQVILHFS